MGGCVRVCVSALVEEARVASGWLRSPQGSVRCGLHVVTKSMWGRLHERRNVPRTRARPARQHVAQFDCCCSRVSCLNTNVHQLCGLQLDAE